MNLYDILACPTCKIHIERQEETLICSNCGVVFPIINNVPILFPDGKLPHVEHDSDLTVRYHCIDWVHRVVLQSLFPDAISLNLGAGNMALDLPNVIRMDITLTPYVDVVGDAHALPFLPDTFDFVFSLAVIEHLKQPFTACQEMYDTLKIGGYVYGECNFVFPYHGFPHHYFNASMQGMLQLFDSFDSLRVGIAPYQMPSFGLRAILEMYMNTLGHASDPGIEELRGLLQQVIDAPLRNYDGYFSEEMAHRTAAGVFFFGVKPVQENSQVIPELLQILWNNTPKLQQKFPDILNLGTEKNVMLWAKREGQQDYEEVATYLNTVQPFHKSENLDEESIKRFAAEPVVEPIFSNVPELDKKPPESTVVDSEPNSLGLKELGRLITRAGEILEEQSIKDIMIEVINYVRWRLKSRA
ncbi:methyltransferase domain-containing protein [Anaerolineales bacterium HSG25]|nr:methyltransferase domain-containing protein [Anaerolineales bacterium HSG25]